MRTGRGGKGNGNLFIKLVWTVSDPAVNEFGRSDIYSSVLFFLLSFVFESAQADFIVSYFLFNINMLVNNKAID